MTSANPRVTPCSCKPRLAPRQPPVMLDVVLPPPPPPPPPLPPPPGVVASRGDDDALDGEVEQQPAPAAAVSSDTTDTLPFSLLARPRCRRRRHSSVTDLHAFRCRCTPNLLATARSISFMTKLAPPPPPLALDRRSGLPTVIAPPPKPND